MKITILTMLSLLLFGCMNKGSIVVDKPEVFTRERLINSRNQEKKWLLEQLNNTDNASRIQGYRDVRQFVAFLNDFSATFNPLGKVTELKQDLEVADLKRLGDNIEKQDEIANLQYDLRIEKLRKELEDLKNGKEGATSELPSALTAPSVGDQVGTTPTSKSLIPQQREALPSPTPQATQAKLTLIEELRDKLAYRNAVRAAIYEQELDDTHDLNGLTLYTLKFDISVKPENHHGKMGKVKINFVNKTTQDTDFSKTYPDVYEAWVRDLRKKIQSEIFSVQKRLDLGAKLPEREAFEIKKLLKDYIKKITTPNLELNNIAEKLKKKAENAVFRDTINELLNDIKKNVGTAELPEKLKDLIEKLESLKKKNNISYGEVKAIFAEYKAIKQEIEQGSSDSSPNQFIDIVSNSVDFIEFKDSAIQQQGQVSDSLKKAEEAKNYIPNLKDRMKKQNLSFDTFDFLSTLSRGESLANIKLEKQNLARPVTLAIIQKYRDYLNEYVDIYEETFEKAFASISIADENKIATMIYELMDKKLPSQIKNKLVNIRFELPNPYNVEAKSVTEWHVKDTQKKKFLFKIVARFEKDNTTNKTILILDLFRTENSETYVDIREENENSSRKEAFYEALKNLETTHRPYIYTVEPKEYAQNISDVSARETYSNFITSLGALIPNSGLQLQNNNQYIRRTQELLNAINRQPLVVGFINNQQEFGWILGPKFKIGYNWWDRPYVDYEHTPKQYSFTASLIVPAWWKKLELQGKYSWSNGANWRNSGSLFKQDNDTTNVENIVAIDLPGDLTAITTALIAKKTFSAQRPRIHLEDDISLRINTKDDNAERTFIIHGQDLWRNPQVFVGNQKAKDVTLLPNMEALLVTFDNLRMPALENPKEKTTKVDLTVITSAGYDIVKEAIKIINVIAPASQPTSTKPTAKLVLEKPYVNKGKRLTILSPYSLDITKKMGYMTVYFTGKESKKTYTTARYPLVDEKIVKKENDKEVTYRKLSFAIDKGMPQDGNDHITEIMEGELRVKLSNYSPEESAPNKFDFVYFQNPDHSKISLHEESLFKSNPDSTKLLIKLRVSKNQRKHFRIAYPGFEDSLTESLKVTFRGKDIHNKVVEDTTITFSTSQFRKEYINEDLYITIHTTTFFVNEKNKESLDKISKFVKNLRSSNVKELELSVHFGKDGKIAVTKTLKKELF
ncbi:hypothetical protein [Candidatus Uabimicrobium amorphum]|uniref:Uncharacterized protein n=1 Tax=Uabimicrobium amorphum TaxID=2596890 RepID=A0A5S9IS77_UABAM|nr:hypothetical protein [Candidatus Uabimicrobium amorphum]BBM86571.1 hypothetical protein UABAM_04957 [Candidatus Uabimicrobium amorphum]